MTEQRRAEIRKIVDNFRGKPLNQKTLTAYCERMHMEVLTMGDYTDFAVQVEHDNMVGKLFPQILAEVQKIQYIPEFASEKVRKELHDQNEEVEINITKLLEKHAVSYRLVSTLTDELAGIVGRTIESGGKRGFNKAMEVLMHLARTKFKGEMNMKHVADYAVEVFDKAKK